MTKDDAKANEAISSNTNEVIDSNTEKKENVNPPDQKFHIIKNHLLSYASNLISLQKQLRFTCQFLCFGSCLYSFYKISNLYDNDMNNNNDISIYLCDLIDFIVCGLMLVAIKNKISYNNWIYIFLGLISTIHLLLFILYNTLYYNPLLSKYNIINDILVIGRNVVNENIGSNIIKIKDKFPISTLYFYIIYVWDKMLDNSCKKALSSLTKFVKLENKKTKKINDESNEIKKDK
jgi:hypothetical protein